MMITIDWIKQLLNRGIKWVSTFIASLSTWQTVVAGGVACGAAYLVWSKLYKQKMTTRRSTTTDTSTGNEEALIPEYDAKMIVDCGNALGECPIWDDRRQLLVWTDIENKRFCSYDPITKESQFIKLDERLGAFCLCEEADTYLFAFEKDIKFYNYKSNKFCKSVCKLEESKPTRLNDGRCDRYGNFIVGGVVDFKKDPKMESYTSIYRITYQSESESKIQSELLIPNIKCSNAICFGLDGNTFYFADSFGRSQKYGNKIVQMKYNKDNAGMY